MDINIVREAVLLLGFGAFVGIVFWAYGAERKSRFERAAVSLFEDDERDAMSVARSRAVAQRAGEDD